MGRARGTSAVGGVNWALGNGSDARKIAKKFASGLPKLALRTSKYTHRMPVFRENSPKSERRNDVQKFNYEYNQYVEKHRARNDAAYSPGSKVDPARRRVIAFAVDPAGKRQQQSHERRSIIRIKATRVCDRHDHGGGTARGTAQARMPETRESPLLPTHEKGEGQSLPLASESNRALLDLTNVRLRPRGRQVGQIVTGVTERPQSAAPPTRV